MTPAVLARGARLLAMVKRELVGVPAFARQFDPRARKLAAAVEAAHALERAWDFEGAAAQWQAVMRAFPQAPVAARGYADVLRRLHRFEESSSLVQAARQLFPDDRELLILQAIVAHARGDFAEALALSLDVVERFPRIARGYQWAGRCYRDMFRYDEAEAILLAGVRRCPQHVDVAAEYAVTADVKGDWVAGLLRWEAILRDFPRAAIAYAGVGAALKRLKRYDEADAILRTGMARFPADDNLGVNYAWVADDRGDFAESLRRWTALRARFPGNPRIRGGWIESQGKAALAEADRVAEQGAAPAPEGGGAPPPMADDEQPPAADDLRHRDLFMRFESLGENCELGFTQQHFGAEPLGLLRWSGVSFELLLHGLAHDFAGVGSTDTTEMGLNPSNMEYYTTDKVYGLNMHTFITRDEGNEDRIFQKLCRRLQYLRVKLLEDLRAAEKIFVFQTRDARTDADWLTLHRAMRRHGPTTLLCIRPQDDANPAGSIRVIEEGLMAGYIDRVGYDGKRWVISFDIWRRLCEQAADLVAAQAVAPTG